MEGLKKKVSKERVGGELKQMLSHPNVFSSFANFKKFNVFPYMVEIPENCQELLENVDLQNQCFDQAFKLAEALKDNLVAEDGTFSFTQNLQASSLSLADTRY